MDFAFHEAICLQSQMLNGSLEGEEEANRIVFLQETNDKQSTELNHIRQRVNSTLSRSVYVASCSKLKKCLRQSCRFLFY